eukprot:5002646-Lingulodinium_polyedra.AAC.1
MQATFAAAAQQPARANCIERPFIRACVLCCIAWHKMPSYMGKDGEISSIFKRNAQKSKHWRPNREIRHALDRCAFQRQSCARILQAPPLRGLN